MSVVSTKSFIAVSEYFRRQREGEPRADYYRGEVFDMAGGSVAHSLICANIVAALHSRVLPLGCRTFESNLRLKVVSTRLITYPDVSVYRQAMTFDEDDPESGTTTNPTLLVEVLSKSTEAYDRGFKAECYRQIPSLKAYLLVSQFHPHVEIVERNADKGWKLDDARGMEGIVRLVGMGLELPLAEIYSQVEGELFAKRE